MGEYGAAGQFAARHIQQRPYRGPEAHLVRARALAAQGNYEEAVRALEDQGYQVDATSADPYSLAAALRVANASAVLPLGNDILRLPVWRLGPDRLSPRMTSP